MRLVKLLAYSLLGYVLYELYLGMTEGADSSRSERSNAGRHNEGMSVPVQDGGGRSNRTAGRGVAH
jgi:hypothetical protein